MQHNEPSYDIHEKIAQLETELLQHELLIRRQKHVISSLKTMITSPQRAWNNSDDPIVQTAPRSVASSAAPSARSNKASSKGAPLPLPAPASVQAPTGSAMVQRKNGTATGAIVERPFNLHKKKSAIQKVDKRRLDSYVLLISTPHNCVLFAGFSVLCLHPTEVWLSCRTEAQEIRCKRSRRE